MIEVVSDYIVTVLKKVQSQAIRSVDVKREVVDEFTEHTHEFLKRTAWTDSCASWFKNGIINGPPVAIWPGSRLKWFEALKEPRFGDMTFTYETKNRFQYFENGFTRREEEGQDLTWYLDKVDTWLDHERDGMNWKGWKPCSANSRLLPEACSVSEREENTHRVSILYFR